MQRSDHLMHLTILRTVFGAEAKTRILPLEFVPMSKLKPLFYRW
jgi:hypothetical protein